MMTTTFERNRRARHVTCLTCEGRTDSEWCRLAGDDLALLDQVKVCNHYDAGQVVFYQGNPCLGMHCIEDGVIALRKVDADGNSLIVRLGMAGNTLGYRSYFADERYTTSAEALTPARVCFVDRGAVVRLLEGNADLARSFLCRLARDVEDSDAARLQAATMPVRTRLAQLLLSLRDRFATVNDDGLMTIQLPLSRQDMAALLGTRPETIARTVRALTDGGVARFDGRRVLVSDLDLLLDEVEPPA